MSIIVTNHSREKLLYVPKLHRAHSRNSFSFQSCIVIYKKASIEEASAFNQKRVKVKTVDGEKHKFKWIEDRDGNVVSIHNAERILIDKSKVNQIVALHPSPHVLPLDSVTRFDGNVSVQTMDKPNHYQSIYSIGIKDWW